MESGAASRAKRSYSRRAQRRDDVMGVAHACIEARALHLRPACEGEDEDEDEEDGTSVAASSGAGLVSVDSRRDSGGAED